MGKRSWVGQGPRVAVAIFCLITGACSLSSATPGPATTDTEAQTTAASIAGATTTTAAGTTLDSSAAPDQLRRATGAQNLAASSFQLLSGKRVGLIGNQTSLTDTGHLADLMAKEPSIDLVALFAPEHGIRGESLAGEAVENSVDSATGLNVFSLYGSTPKPTSEMLKDIDVLVFDIQDVGARFYTFISTMGLAMQAAAEANIEFVVLDRPNPHGGATVAGFTRTDELESFVGQYRIPSTYGLTAGELAMAIRGEAWMGDLASLDLTVVELSGWSRNMLWTDWSESWVPPSPALPTFTSALAYPGVVLFEATTLDYGRGSDSPFLRIVGPGIDGEAIAASLNSSGLAGVSFDAEPGGVRYNITNPSVFEPVSVGVHVLKAFVDAAPEPIIDRPGVFDLLAGSPRLQEMLTAGADASSIVEAWQDDVAAFELVRSKYLLY